MTDSPEAIVKTYLNRMAEIRGSGGATDETSYYSAFENLMNAIGKFLNPNIICNGQLKSLGAGHPDFGFYSKNQCSKGAPKSSQGDIPERGVVEAKGVDDNSLKTSVGTQTQKYLIRYGLVLVTNYREFRLMALDDAGMPVQREYFSIAEDETSFWKLASTPQKSADSIGQHLCEFIKRVMMNAAPLTHAEDIAWFLASYARDALATLEEKDGSTLAPLRNALETALGIKFEGEKGEHFFRSTLVQTLFYGTFSAWAIWEKSGKTGKFDWRHAGYILTVPMIRSLFEEIAKPSRMAPLGLMEILDRTGEALDRVDQTAFFKSFDTGQAIQHFYEPFLEAYDPDLRKEMGVWYTPPEIVRYMVERVDAVLRSELGIADGLADKNVYVLDPCCGTGAFVIEVLRKIEETLRAKGDDPLIGEDVKEAATKRIFGFEIMSAPFVIAHWQIGNLLTALKAPLDPAKGERPSIYLTNALTGWEPPSGPKATLPLFPELADERDQAEHVKQDVPILVVLGNPPYNAYSGTSPDEERGLVEPYKKGLISDWGIKKFNLDDLYVRFFRIAERRIAETGRGIVSYISNYSYTSEPSYVVMRQHLLDSFDKFWIENMHGDRNRSEYAPDGRTSETIFALRGFSTGIRQGVVIGLAVKTGKGGEQKIVRYRNDIDAAKADERKAQLLNSLSVTPFDDQYETADPQDWNRLSFRPGDVGIDYLAWPKLINLAAIAPINGLMEKRGGALIDIDRNNLAKRMQQYFDPSIDWAAYKLLGSSLTKDAARYDAEKTRAKVQSTETYDDKRLVRYFVRPFDSQYAYYTGIRPVWNEPRPSLWELYQIRNAFLMSRMTKGSDPEGPPFYFTCDIGDDHFLRTDAYFFGSQYLRDDGPLLGATVHANLSDPARAFLCHLGFPDPDKDFDVSCAIWLHCLAIGFSQTYLDENKDGISIDWPRIPLPNSRVSFDSSIVLGQRLKALLDPVIDVQGISSGTVNKLIKIMGSISDTNLAVSANWGNRDSKGRVNPAKGKTETRAWTSDEEKALKSGFASFGLSETRGFELLGVPVDVYLNDTTHWRSVPEAVWNYHIGGYQVIKKWLSYRDESVLGRSLTKEEAREVTGMVRRIAAIILMTDALDANYVTARDNAYSWPL